MGIQDERASRRIKIFELATPYNIREKLHDVFGGPDVRSSHCIDPGYVSFNQEWGICRHEQC